MHCAKPPLSFARRSRGAKAILQPRRLLGDITEANVALDRFGISFRWRTHAAAARHRNDHPIPRRNDLQPFGAKLLAGRQVFEVQLSGFDKGRAITRFMDELPFAGRMPVCPTTPA